MIVRWTRRIAIVFLVQVLLLAGALSWAPVTHERSDLGLEGIGRRMDMTALPTLSRFAARDGTRLAYRHYPGQRGQGTAILIHGSSANSAAIHPLARALAASGVTVYVPDLRGHGESGPRGDIGYVGQLDDDLADLATLAGRENPGERRLLIGHSSGGAFVLRVANGKHACDFDSFAALSPFLNHKAPTARPRNGNWSSVSIPRIVALTTLNRFHVDAFGHLPVLAFSIPKGNRGGLTGSYSWRLMRNFGLDMDDWQDQIRVIQRPAAIAIGEKDQLFYPERFAPLMQKLAPGIAVNVWPGIDHMGMVYQADALTRAKALARKMLDGPALARCSA